MFKITKPIFYWALYDFANSLIVTNFTLYFSQWLIVENGLADIWYGASIAISTIVLLATAPFFGSRADKTHKKMVFIVPLSICFSIATILLGIVGGSTLAFYTKVISAFVISIAVQYSYQLSLVFYDTYLADLTTRENYGKISGFGEALGNFGSIAGLFLTFPFVNGSITLFGEPGRIQAFVPAGLGFILLALPLLITFKDSRLKRNTVTNFSYKEILKSFKDLLKNKNILWFLIAFYFISDVVLTVQTFFPIYFEQVLGLTDFEKIQAAILLLVFIVIGGLMLGRLSDKIGFRKMVIISTSVLLVLFATLPLIKNITLIWIILPFAGLFWGGFYSSARALLTKLAPADKRTEFFSLYTIFRRSASIFGPLLWSLSVFMFSGYGLNKYRISIYPLIVFMIVGVWFLLKVRDDKNN